MSFETIVTKLFGGDLKKEIEAETVKFIRYLDAKLPEGPIRDDAQQALDLLAEAILQGDAAPSPTPVESESTSESVSESASESTSDSTSESTSDPQTSETMPETPAPSGMSRSDVTSEAASDQSSETATS